MDNFIIVDIMMSHIVIIGEPLLNTFWCYTPLITSILKSQFKEKKYNEGRRHVIMSYYPRIIGEYFGGDLTFNMVNIHLLSSMILIHTLRFSTLMIKKFIVIKMTSTPKLEDS